MYDPLSSPLVTILVLAIPLALLLLYLLGRQYRALKERQWLHEETMTALKQGLAVDLPGDRTMRSSTASQLHPQSATDGPVQLLWMRALAASFGLLGIFVGAGILVSFVISTNEEANEFWPMGLIPIFGGVGMMLLYLMLTHSFRPRRPAEPGTERDRLSGSDS